MNTKLDEQFEGIDALMAYYAEIDNMTAAAVKEAGVSCMQGCSKCCDTSSRDIEATMFELIPMALHLWQRGQAEHYQALASEAGDEGRCVLYMPEGTDSGGGGCSEYEHRALICRLFGITSVRDKHGNKMPSLCMLIAAHNPKTADKITAHAPVIAECSAHGRGLSPSSLGSELYSFNMALKLALEKVMLTAQLMGIEMPKND